MKTKLVYESLDDVLKPKSEEDIISNLKSLSQEEKDKKLIFASKMDYNTYIEGQI